MARRDVVITGLGLVSPLGNTVKEFWDGMLFASPLPTVIEDPGFPSGSIAYQVDEEPEHCHQPGGRAASFAVAAARAAATDADLASLPGDAGVFLGTILGEAPAAAGSGSGSHAGNDGWWRNTVTSAVANELDLAGPNVTVSTACTAGSYAVALAARDVAVGRSEVALAGGVDIMSRVTQSVFLRLGAVDPEHCRPFDRWRRGTVYGEGAAFLVLESAAHAARRGVTPYAKVSGAGWSCDGKHPTAPDPEGIQAAQAGLAALADAGIDAGQVAAVLCHGTGTPLNDVSEARVLSRVLADRAATVPVTAIKSKLGHSGGAAGAFSCLVAALAVRHRYLPPTAHLREQDPACPLRIVADGPVPIPDGHVLVNAFAFGGNNISLLVGPVTR